MILSQSPEAFPQGGIAVVVGAGGGIGAALLRGLEARGDFARIVGSGRSAGSERSAGIGLDLLAEPSIAAAAARLREMDGELRLVIDATGFLHGGGFTPEKSLRDLDPAHLAHAFAVNAIGPALLMKHLLPLLPRRGKAVFATLSARVGSIGDNRLGGWYAYRASKAAQNQLVRTAAVELHRRCPEAACVALHPGTVDTGLSGPFAKAGLDVQTPDEAAARLLAVIDRLGPRDNGGFFDHRGAAVPW